MVSTRSSRCGAAGGEAAPHAVRAHGLDAEDQAIRAELLDRAGDPGQQAAAADRHEDRVEIGGLLQPLESDGAGAARREWPLERMDEGAPLLSLDPLGEGEALGDVGHHHQLGAVAARPARPGPDWRWPASPPWRGCRARAPPRRWRSRGCPRSPRSRRAPARRGPAQHHRERTARLERAGVLEQLELEVDARYRPAAGRRAPGSPSRIRACGRSCRQADRR